VVLEEGRITEMGHHSELIKRGGLYKQLYEMQFRYETSDETEDTAEPQILHPSPSDNNSDS
jgi:hypothetical protein